MSSCSCKLKSGERKGQRCNAKVKTGRFCGRHTNCADIMSQPQQKTQKSQTGNVHNVVFEIKYDRNNDESLEKNPSAAALERYVSASDIIPANVDYMNELVLTSPVKYIGKCRFSFTCETDLNAKEIANLFLLQSLADGEWGAAPGDGSFVYPTKNGEELGLLSFKCVVVDGKTFK